MVGLVIVSHSRALAEAAAKLARDLADSGLPVDFAGGSGDNRRLPGTDATDIMEAIMRVNGGDGVVVLMDHGDAAVNAGLAEQLLGSDVPGIRLCPAPLVEGALAAAAAMKAGSPAAAVADAARNALAAKFRDMEEDFGDAPAAHEPEAAEAVPAAARRILFRVADPAGMHLRPAARLVETLAPFAVNARIRNYDADGAFFNAAGINRTALADIRSGDAAEIVLWGEDAPAAFEAVRALVRDLFPGGEFNPDEIGTAFHDAARDAEDGGGDARPVPLAPGAAAGTLYIHRRNRDRLPPLPVADPEYEISRLGAALDRVRAGIGAQRDKLAARGAAEASVLEDQLLILGDPGLLEQIHADIRRQSRDAASCCQARMLDLAAAYRELGNSFLRGRAADAAGVCDQVLDALKGKSAQDLESVSGIILWTEEATPDLLVRWAPGQLRGVLTRCGAPASHVAILAKAMGVPALAGYALPGEATTGLAVAMDADRAEVVVAPSAGVLRDFEARRDAWRAEAAEDRANSAGPAVTADGQAVAVLANIGDVRSAGEALENGAEGAGLLRTEFLFLDRTRPPEEEEQAESLAAVFALFGGRPVTVRTLDVFGGRRAGDASTRSLLGVRGVRLYRRNPALFRTHLRAILRAGRGGNVDIMIPMVAAADEIDFCRAALEACHADLAAAGIPHLWPVKMGILVETPAAALQADALAKKADFFSIGTNDLTQYVMCAERGMAELAALSDSRQPAVLEAIALAAKAAAANGIPVSVCGEMAADPAAVPDLLRLGIRAFSMSSPSIGRIKKTIRAVKCGSAAM